MIRKLLSPISITYNSKTHIPALDGIRGLAILSVVIYHCFPSLYKVGAGVGWMGVDLFFVLSGFLITGILLETKTREGYLRNFFARRILRIFPLYYLFLIVFFLIVPLFASSDWLSGYTFLYEHQIWYWLYIPNWLIAFQNHWPPVAKPILDHYWSLAIEEQFYIFWPFVVLFTNRKSLIIICLYLIAQSVVVRNIFESIGINYSTSYVFTFARLDAISLGALIAVLIRDEKSKKMLENLAPKVFFGSLLTIGLIIVISRSLSLKDPYFIRIGYTVIALMFGSLLLYALSDRNSIKKIAESRFLRFFGTYSYGIYVYHWALYPLMNDIFVKKLDFIHSDSLKLFISSIICVVIIIITALISWHVFEKQFLKLKKYVDYKPVVNPV